VCSWSFEWIKQSKRWLSCSVIAWLNIEHAAHFVSLSRSLFTFRFAKLISLLFTNWKYVVHIFQNVTFY